MTSCLVVSKEALDECSLGAGVCPLYFKTEKRCEGGLELGTQKVWAENRQLTRCDEVKLKECTEFSHGLVVLARVNGPGNFSANSSAGIPGRIEH